MFDNFEKRKSLTLGCKWSRSKYLIASLISCVIVTTNFLQVSCGEFGNANSKSVDRTNSNTQATQPLFDSTRYYYLNWDAAAPAALVVCEWEDVIFRLETLNLLQRIFDKFVSFGNPIFKQKHAILYPYILSQYQYRLQSINI